MKLHQHNDGYMTKVAAMSIYGRKKHFIIYFPGTTGKILLKLCMKHKRPYPLICCSNYDTGLTLTYFIARSNFATEAFIWENVTMMDSTGNIASCDLDFG